ncbi:MAG: hypothetical protein K2Q26_05050 [Bdellovibrionales bacterium]|nr:hypothetical protein [Bdellovibrionales bacterium]
MDSDVFLKDKADYVQKGFSALQKYVLLRFHPRSIFIDSIGQLWFIYYLWDHNLMSALAALTACRLVSLLSVIDIDTNLFARTTLGKVALLHLHPYNLILQLIGTLVLIYGVWQNSAEILLIGISWILFGHVWGWGDVDRRFADKGDNC